jgi:hypothetical protein
MPRTRVVLGPISGMNVLSKVREPSEYDSDIRQSEGEIELRSGIDVGVKT